MTSAELVEEIVETSKKPARKRKKLQGNLNSGADLVNLVLGGDLTYGFVNIAGDSSSGKSFISGECIAANYHLKNGNLQWFYHDAEDGYKFDTQKLYNMDILGGGLLKQSKSERTIESFERNLNEVIAKKDPDVPFIYVLDSFDSLTSHAELDKLSKNRKKKEGEKKEGSYALDKQKFMHQIGRTYVSLLQEHKICVIIVSQVKENVDAGMYGPKHYRTGGKALDFYPNIIFWITEAEKYTKQNRAVGICSKVLGKKVRNDKPFRHCYIDILFDLGVDNLVSNLKFLYDYKTDRGKDKTAVNVVNNMKWDDKTFDDLDHLVQYIEDNDLEQEVLKRTQEKWHQIDEEISSNHRKKKWS